MVPVLNIGHVGVVTDVKVKGSRAGWITMRRNWGQVGDTGRVLTGQSLSFKVTVSDGKWLEFDNVAPTNWKFNQNL
ncbi:unnamed protein product [Arabis nemorensis]|uniref:Expansin n=1 Tax=Arabis nemorensis TaxID=586526 RepID=A0A565CM69_9BRAS|nr:unnamed protein product [Arabis nemorensis]